MNTDPISFNKVEKLLSQLAGKDLTKTDLTPPFIFLTNLVMVWFGIMKVNNSVDNTKLKQLLTTLDQFSDLESNVHELTHLVVQRLSDNSELLAEFTTPTRLSTLTTLYSESEKLLLIGLCYKMLAANGTIDDREKRELNHRADRIIKEQHITVLEAGFGYQETLEPASAALTEVESLLKDEFGDLGNSFVSVASDLLAVLSTKFKPSEIPTPHKQTQVLKKILPNAKPSDIFSWEPKSKEVPKSPIGVSSEDATGRAYFD
jgi:hypothetical protein